MKLISVIVLLFVANTAAVTETFVSTNSVSHLLVNLQVEGDVKVYSNSASKLTLTVTTDSTTSTKPSIRFMEDPLSGTVSLTIESSTSSSSEVLNSGVRVTFVLALLSSLLASRFSSPLLSIVLFGVIVGVSTSHVFAEEQVLERADVAVFIPRDYVFESVTLTAQRGSVVTDQTILSSSVNVQCFSGIDERECKSCCNANGQCMDGVCSCKASFSGDDCAIQTGTLFTLHGDPADPVIMTLDTVEGEELQILGDKDGNGIPLSVNRLILDDGEGLMTYVNLNQTTSLPERFSTESGVRIYFEWSEDFSMVHVTAVSPDGQRQVTINVRLDDGITKRDIQIRSTETQTLVPTKRQSVEEVNQVTLRYIVLQCGQPVDDAILNVRALLGYNSTSGDWLDETDYLGISTDEEGVYHIQISTGERSPLYDNVEDVCLDVVNYLGNCGTFMGLQEDSQRNMVCDPLTTQFENFDVITACQAGFRAIETYCGEFGEAAEDNNIAESVCGSVATDESLRPLFETRSILLQNVSIDGVTVEGERRVLHIPSGFRGLYSITVHNNCSEPVIAPLTVSPIDPDPHQDYVVNIEYTCPTETLNVTMSIVGTDGYTDNTVCTGVTYSCTLDVPGGEMLVEDEVTVELRDDVANYTLIRQVTVVF